jgi:hypothetical protein
MSDRLAFSQLWVEEEAYLRAAGESLPAGAVIVELGTAQGGSAYLFSQATRGQHCTVLSYDLATSAEARSNLEGLGVRLMAESSTAGAARWSETCGRAIDCLFIDASHTLANVYRDYDAWVPFLAPGARVLFHDYDRPERGGIAHLGVRVFLDGLLSAGVLRDVEHVGRILAARVEDPLHARLSLSSCERAWRAIGDGLRGFRGTCFEGWQVLGTRDARGELLALLLGIEGAPWHTRLALGQLPPKLLVVERPLSDSASRVLRERRTEALLVDDLVAGYLLGDALIPQRDALLALTRNRGAFFKWEEFLEMLAHACPSPDGDAVFDAQGLDLDALSRRCAREMLRLAFLDRLSHAITDQAERG